MLTYDGNNNLLINAPKSVAQAGLLLMAGTGKGATPSGTFPSPPRLAALSTNNRLEGSRISPLFAEYFNYTTQNTGRWNFAQNVMDFTFVNTGKTPYGTGVCVNWVAGTAASGACAVMKPYWSTPMPTEGSIVMRFTMTLASAPPTNCILEMGNQPLVVPASAATDGVFFRYTAAGILVGVMNFNGTETTTASMVTPSYGVEHIFEIVLATDRAEFWIDGGFQAMLPVQSAQGYPCMCPMLQPVIRMWNSGTASVAQALVVYAVDVWQTDGSINRESHFKQAEQGLMGYQGLGGQTMGSTASYANNTTPTPGVPTNTTALVTGLGGQVAETPTAATNLDGILCSFQVPVPTVNLPGRKLVITGVRINTGSNSAGFTVSGPQVVQYTLNFGHTSVSLATTEAANAKAPRRVPLGIQSWSAAALTAGGSACTGQGISVSFINPIVVNPGEFVAISSKNAVLGISGGGSFIHQILFDAHWD